MGIGACHRIISERGVSSAGKNDDDDDDDDDDEDDDDDDERMACGAVAAGKGD